MMLNQNFHLKSFRNHNKQIKYNRNKGNIRQTSNHDEGNIRNHNKQLNYKRNKGNIILDLESKQNQFNSEGAFCIEANIIHKKKISFT